jgi:micrococcal nuclease
MHPTIVASTLACLGGAIGVAPVLAQSSDGIPRPYSDELLLNGDFDYFGYEAQVIDIIDADTLKLDVYLWPGQKLTTNVRSRGVDTPELRGADCAEEKALAEEATASIERMFPPGTWVYVNDVDYDKYGKRFVAQIDRWASDRFRSVTEELLEREFGVPYDGGTKIYDWCSAESRQ